MTQPPKPFLPALESLMERATKGESCWYDMDQFFRNHAPAIAAVVRALEPFAKFACPPDDDGPCGCFNCVARDALAALNGEAKP